MKKSFNPFKLWGSYLGAVIGFIIAFMGIPIAIMGGNLSYIIIILASVLGFLAGWGIHALIRLLRELYINLIS